MSSSALIKKVEQFATTIVSKNLDESSIEEYAQKVESIKKYRTKDYDKSLSHFLQKEVDIYKDKESNGNNFDKSTVKILDTAKKLLAMAKKIRRNNRQASKVDTNILTASPFFVGRKRELIKQGKERGYISFEHNGVKKLTYENKLGELLTYNDAKTLFALFALWDEQGKDDWLSFTKYQLLNKMNLVDGGRQYQIVHESIEKLKNTWVVLHEAYFIEKGKRDVTKEFPLIIGHNSITESFDNGNLKSTTYEIRFSEFIYKSIQNGNYSLISLALWDEIDSDSGKAIYSMISGISNMEDNSQYLQDDMFVIPLNVVYKHLKLENPKPAKNREVVEKGCAELQSIEVIKEFNIEKVAPKTFNLVIEPSDWLNNILSKKKVLPNVEQVNLPLLMNEEEKEIKQPIYDDQLELPINEEENVAK
ncbi:replication initiator protein A [Priestia megaterium]|uniref:replication initiator protein A n=1 Tax=Priestia megaterium TaxID=1404 RepID=UPI002E1DB31B|nr:replication initiator protein A [Priestia megaterium]